MTSPRYLTKSRFKLAVDCPTKLFYYGKSKEYRDAMAENDFLAMLAEGGYQVGALAKLRYPGGIEIKGLNHAAAEAQTREYLQHDDVVLFEPAIRVGDFFIRIDILVKTGNQFELIEVKAKSYNSLEPGIEGKRGGISSGMLPYIQDAAFQTRVLRQAFPAAQITTALMMPDKAQFAPLDGINQMFKINEHSDVEVRIPQGMDMKALAETLLARVCVDRYVEQILNQPLDFPGGPASLGDAAAAWAEAYRDDRRIAPVIGAQCGGCQFKAAPGDTLKSGFHECWKAANGWEDKNFDGGTVLDLWNFRGKQKLIEQGVLKISQVMRDDLGEFDDEPDADGLNRKQRQWLQVDGIPEDYDCGGYYFDRALAAVEMARWHFPLHFIDFETSTVALPFYKDMRPYEPVAFQFSHHIMETDGSVRHDGQFLCVEPGEFPNYRFARALKEALEGDDGSVFMWSHHENTILSKIVEQLAEDPNRPEDAEDLASFLKRLIKGGDRAMVDLCQTFEAAGLFLAPGELPDHLTVVLQYASTQPPAQAKAFLGEVAHILQVIFSALLRREAAHACVLAALLDLAGEKAQAVTVPVEPELDESWAEPMAFDGCSTQGQARPGQAQPIQIVRNPASSKNPMSSTNPAPVRATANPSLGASA